MPIIFLLGLLLAQAAAFVVPQVPRVAASRATSLWAVGPNSDAPKANMFAKPKAFLRKALARPRAVARRCLQSAPVTALACAVILSSATPAMAKTERASKFDYSDEASEQLESKKSFDANSVKAFFIIGGPLILAKTITRSKERRKKESTRVNEAITRLETMRDEFMNVEGQSSTDEDLFASLKGRTEELSEEEAEAAAQAAETAAAEEVKAAKARGVEDLFVGNEDETEKDEDEDEDAEAIASKEDVERLKRMFGSS